MRSGAAHQSDTGDRKIRAENTPPVGACSTTLPTYHVDFAKSTVSKPTLA